jgi:hypothetical protein
VNHIFLHNQVFQFIKKDQPGFSNMNAKLITPGTEISALRRMPTFLLPMEHPKGFQAVQRPDKINLQLIFAGK